MKEWEVSLKSLVDTYKNVKFVCQWISCSSVEKTK